MYRGFSYKPLFWYADESLEMLWIAVWAIASSIIGWRIHNPLVLIIKQPPRRLGHS
ncbi:MULTISPECIES: hypothetical protein [Aerosakkonema]|uniref:hypothetical protein n=1 Tax=Aerosakkonema TaxID=1246629 RepID=UPI0035B70085